VDDRHPGHGNRAAYHPDRIPGAENARVPPGKTAWLISGKHAQLFHDHLGFTDTTNTDLRRELLAELPTVKGAISDATPAGKPKWVAIIQLSGPRRSADVLTVWEIGWDGVPDLITAYGVSSKRRLQYGL
jgi:hypothetical protein